MKLTGCRSPGLLTAAMCIIVASCGTGNERPADDAWRQTWEQRRDAFPDAEAFIAGGTELCDALVGELRVTLPDLDPAPTEALDDAVQAWVDHAETIAFECSHDPAQLADALELLAIFEAEIEAGLLADQRR
jgi:hypothetical protein